MHTIDYLFSLQSKVRRATTPTERAFALGSLAFTEMRMGKTEEAEQKLADISMMSESPANPEIVALHLYLVGVFDFYFGRTSQSVANLLNARQLARLSGSAKVEARALAALCSSLITLGAHSDAFEAADQALEIAEAAGDDRAITIARISLANLYIERDDAAAALAQIDAVQPVLVRLNDPFTLTSAHSSRIGAMIINLRKLVLSPGEENRAEALKILSLCEQAVTTADATHHIKARVRSWRNLASAHYILDDVGRALAAINHAIALCTEAQAQDNLPHAQFAKATYLMRLGSHAEAAEILTMARASAKNAENLTLQARIAGVGVECLEKMGDIPGALAASKEHARLLSLQRAGECANLDMLRKAKRESAEAQLEAAAARKQTEQMGKVQAQLVEDTQKFKQISFEDALTSLKNRRYFDFRFPELIKHHSLEKTSLSMAIIDIDAFKSINDQHGHVIGDTVLKGVAYTLLAQKRAGDEACRLGGDEFVLFMPNAHLDDARAICENVRQQFSVGNIAREYGVSLSIGVAEWNSNEDHTAFLTRADKKLFIAKREGRNRVAA